MENWKRRVLVLLLGLYMTTMLVFTFVSRYTVLSLLPCVTITQATEEGWIDSRAVHYGDNDEPFVYWVAPTETILGDGYALSAWPVSVAEEQGGRTKALGAEQIGAVALDCDQTMKEGMNVRLSNEE